MNARRFRLYGDSEIARITQGLQSAVDGWAEEWLVSVRPQVQVDRNSYAVTDPAWQWRATDTTDVSANGIAVGCQANWIRAVKLLLTGIPDGGDPAGGIAPGVGDALLTALIDTVAGVSGRVATPSSRLVPMPVLDADLSRPGSGCLGAEVVLTAGATLRLVLWPELLERWLGDMPAGLPHDLPLVPVQQGLEVQSVTLEVIAGSAELSLTELQSLAAGDVIRLDRRLADPLAVLFDGEQQVAAGHLGALQGRRSVQLTVG